MLVEAKKSATEASSAPADNTTAAEAALTDLSLGTVTANSAQPLPGLELVPKTPPKIDSWELLRRNMHLARHLDQKRVQQELRWIQRHPDYLMRLESRLQTYLPYIYDEVMDRNMPAELTLLPIVESALDVYAFSHGGAAGPWQFLRGTARQYKLEINDWYDGRRDIVASTQAALDFLTDLHNRFGDWNLALAGYNAGQGNVNKALRKNPNTHYFNLDLPRETQRYVPRLLALAEIVAQPEKYGIQLPDVEPKPQFHIVDTHGQFQLNKLADLIGLSEEELYKYNPSMNSWATPPKGPHRIIVPLSVDLASSQSAINELPESQRLDWQQVTVRSGDTLSQIARRHGVDIASIQSANDLNGNRIRAGAKLLVPTRVERNTRHPFTGKSSKGHTQYTVQSGDSLWVIAKRNKVSLNALMKANHIGPRDTLSVGKVLSIPGSGTKSARSQVTRKVHYKVRRGDSLARIASKFDVTVKQLATWNKLDAKRYLQPGQGLLVYVSVVGG